MELKYHVEYMEVKIIWDMECAHMKLLCKVLIGGAIAIKK